MHQDMAGIAGWCVPFIAHWSRILHQLTMDTTPAGWGPTNTTKQKLAKSVELSLWGIRAAHKGGDRQRIDDTNNGVLRQHTHTHTWCIYSKTRKFKLSVCLFIIQVSNSHCTYTSRCGRTDERRHTMPRKLEYLNGIVGMLSVYHTIWYTPTIFVFIIMFSNSVNRSETKLSALIWNKLQAKKNHSTRFVYAPHPYFSYAPGVCACVHCA